MIRVFPRRNKWTPTDDLAFVGYPPLFLPPKQSVRVSVTFTWDIPLAQKIYHAWAAKRAGIDIGLYCGTKHSLGCQLLNSGVREDVLMALFGHRERKSTKRYAQLVTDSLKYWEDE